MSIYVDSLSMGPFHENLVFEFPTAGRHAGDEGACDYVGRKMNYLKLSGRRTSADLWGCAVHGSGREEFDAFSITTDWLAMMWRLWTCIMSYERTIHFVLACRCVCSDTPNKLNKEQTNDFKSKLIDMRSFHTSTAHTMQTSRYSHRHFGLPILCRLFIPIRCLYLPNTGSRQAFAFIQIQSYIQF